MTPARRGDLMVYQTRHRDSYQGGGTHTRVQYRVAVVTGVHRDGRVSRFRTGGMGESTVATVYGWTGRTWLVDRDRVNAARVADRVGATVYATLDAATHAVRPYITAPAVTPA